jgi:hypothetical protein
MNTAQYIQSQASLASPDARGGAGVPHVAEAFSSADMPTRPQGSASTQAGCLPRSSARGRMGDGSVAGRHARRRVTLSNVAR